MKRIILLGLVVIIVVVGGFFIYSLLSSSDQQVAQVTSTPSSGSLPSATPTPAAQQTLGDILQAVDEDVDLANSGTPLQELKARVGAITVTSQGFTQLLIRTASKGTEVLSAREVLDRLLVSYPPALRAAFAGDSGVFVYGQNEIFDAQGTGSLSSTPEKRYVFVFEVGDTAAAQAAVQQWEADMPTALVGLLDINPVKGAGFLDNQNQGISIRYQNFPFPDRSIDYVFIPYGERIFLIVSGSREATYATINKFQ